MKKQLTIILSVIFIIAYIIENISESNYQEEPTASVTNTLEKDFAGGLPRMTVVRAEQIIERKTYTVSYNKDTRHPNWSAWTLTRETAEGPYKRKDLGIKGDYLEDEDNIKGRQRHADWKGTPGYDHGHMCPSGDNKGDLEAMRQTFYLSNMCVQKSELNQGTWENLESTCRSWAKKYGRIYIVCGPIFSTTPMRKIGDKERLFVPDAFFKVVLRMEGEPQALGFIYQNETPLEGDRLESHVVAVDEVEAITGLDFFSTLPDDLENTIEAHSEIRNWKKR